MTGETLCDSSATRRFFGIALGDEHVAEETTIFNFRRLLDWHGLTGALFAQVNAHRDEQWPRLRSTWKPDD